MLKMLDEDAKDLYNIDVLNYFSGIVMDCINYTYSPF